MTKIGAWHYLFEINLAAAPPPTHKLFLLVLTVAKGIAALCLNTVLGSEITINEHERVKNVADCTNASPYQSLSKTSLKSFMLSSVYTHSATHC